jgi:hypothetical protein
MGPLRTAWTFPYTGKELIEACLRRESQYVGTIEEKIDEEQAQNRRIDEHREVLRKAGVAGWENAYPEDMKSRAGYAIGSSADLRNEQGKAKKLLVETQRFRRQLEHDLLRDEHRLYKLTIDDVIYFGL